MKKRTSRSTSGPRKTSSRSGTSGRTAGTAGDEATEDAKYKDSPFAYLLEDIRKMTPEEFRESLIRRGSSTRTGSSRPRTGGERDRVRDLASLVQVLSATPGTRRRLGPVREATSPGAVVRSGPRRPVPRPAPAPAGARGGHIPAPAAARPSRPGCRSSPCRPATPPAPPAGSGGRTSPAAGRRAGGTPPCGAGPAGWRWRRNRCSRSRGSAG